MTDIDRQQILAFNRRLLEAIRTGDYATYESLCDPDMTCIEPETLGQIVAGRKFHQHYFDLPAAAPGVAPATNITMCDVTVRVAGTMACVTYNRLSQKGTDSFLVQETRIWEKKNGAWKHTHFHRSQVSKI